MPVIHSYEIVKTVRIRVSSCESSAEAHRLADEVTDMTQWTEDSVQIKEWGGSGSPRTISAILAASRRS